MCVFNFRKKYEIILFESNYKAIGCSLLISSWLKNFSVLHNAHCGFSAKEIDFRVEFERRQQRIIISCLVVEHLRSHSTTFKKRRRFKAERSGSSYKNNPTPPHIQPQKTTNLEQKYFTINMYTIGNLGLLQTFVNMQESCVKKFWFDGQKKKKRRID